MLLLHSHVASNLSVHVTLRSAERQLDAALGLEGPVTSALGSRLRASLGHTVPGLRHRGLPFSVDGRGHLQVGEGAGPGPRGGSGPERHPQLCFSQSVGPSLAVALMVNVDGDRSLQHSLLSVTFAKSSRYLKLLNYKKENLKITQFFTSRKVSL